MRANPMHETQKIMRLAHELVHYEDRFGVRHDARLLMERATLVEVIGKVEREYYGSRWEDCVHRSDDGRTFTYHSPTDYGCSGHWTDDEHRVWYRDSKMYGTLAVIEPKDCVNPKGGAE